MNLKLEKAMTKKRLEHIRARMNGIVNRIQAADQADAHYANEIAHATVALAEAAMELTAILEEM